MEYRELTASEKRWRRVLKILAKLALAVAVYGVLVVAARFLHRRVLYQPPDGDVKAALPEGAALLTTKAADGVDVHALEFVAPKAKRTLVHFHGNAETADDNASLAREFVKKGFSIVLVEYRGYGRSRGTSPTEEGLYADASAVLDLLKTRGASTNDIVLWGQSLGTGVAVEMARQNRGSRLVLVAPLTSTVDLANRVAPFFPLSFVMADKFDTISKAPSIAFPTLVVHGDIDDVIPFEEGERVSQALPKATLLKVPEGRHDNLYKSVTVTSAIAAHASAER